MLLSQDQKAQLTRELVDCLKEEEEISKIVVFGSFWDSDDPQDLDVAIFQKSQESYLPLALKYRRKARPVARRIALDIVPCRAGATHASFLKKITEGKVIYER